MTHSDTAAPLQESAAPHLKDLPCPCTAKEPRSSIAQGAKLDELTADVTKIGASVMVVLKACEAKMVAYIEARQTARPMSLRAVAEEVAELVSCTAGLSGVAAKFTQEAKRSVQSLTAALAGASEVAALVAVCTQSITGLEQLGAEIQQIQADMQSGLERLEGVIEHDNLNLEAAAISEGLFSRLRAR